MSSQQPLPPKKEVALALLERSSVHVHLDPRLDGVVVPPWFKKKEQLVLQIGLNMPVPIPDLQLDDEGMSCTLSFNRSPFFCIVPWGSVFAIVGEDGRGMVWPDDVPPEVAQQGQEQAQRAEARSEMQRAVEAVRSEPQQGKRPALEEVRAEGAAKPKRTRKKPQVVPAPAGDEPSVRAPGAQGASGRDCLAPVPSPDASRARPMPTAARPMPKPQPPRKPKRELPPYLRVVK